MAIKNSFLSKLFGSDPVESEQEKAPQAETEQAQEAPAPPEPPPPQLDPAAQLQLPPEHAMHRLWRLRREQAGWLPSPMLYLSAPPGEAAAMAAEEIQKELPRLLVTATSTANKRLTAATPEKEDAPQPDLDAQAVIFLPNKQMSAWLLVYPPVGNGRELDREMLDKALEESKVRFGLETALLERLPKDPERYFRLFLVARGRPAVNGKDGYVVDLYPRVVQREADVNEFDQVDYTSLNFVQNADKGDEICRIIPPTPGVPGKTVLDQELPAKDGKKASPPKGRNTEVSEDGTKLVALLAGNVEFTGRGFQIKPVLEIPGNVDFSTGNINFLGDVRVRGDVCSGFAVRALGNVTVDGVVEACSVEAGGDLIVAKGVQGNNQAVLRAHRTVYAKYLENSSVYARENLQTDCIINCDVYSDGVVSVRSGRGTIIGGRVRAAHEVNAGIVGSKSERLTMVILGGLPCEEFEHELLLREKKELEEDYEKTERQPDSPVKLSRMSNLRMKLSINRMKLEQFEKDFEKLKEELKEEDIRRMVCGVIYPGTEITIGHSTLRLEHETRQCTATLINGEVRLI